MSTTFTEFVTLTRVDCGKCGATYAINERFRKLKEEQGGTWHRSYCDCEWGFVTSQVTKLSRELEEKSRALTASRCETLKERNLRELAEKRLRRVGKGVCPCCNRSFQNLQRHMATKHPEKKDVK